VRPSNRIAALGGRRGPAVSIGAPGEKCKAEKKKTRKEIVRNGQEGEEKCMGKMRTVKGREDVKKKSSSAKKKICTEEGKRTLV